MLNAVDPDDKYFIINLPDSLAFALTFNSTLSKFLNTSRAGVSLIMQSILIEHRSSLNSKVM